MATKIAATDLEQIDSLKRLTVQLTLGIKEIENLQTNIYAADLIVEKDEKPDIDPSMLRQKIITTLVSLRRVSSQFIYDMQDIKTRSMAGRGQQAEPTPQAEEKAPSTQTDADSNGVHETPASQPELEPQPAIKTEPELAPEENVPEVEWQE